ncbi:MAG TPA: hypothetical protein VFQ39_14640, partial [Longimicrobium sp.]|nr:hypothetical protein [Longimicrobium sp.]
MLVALVMLARGVLAPEPGTERGTRAATAQLRYLGRGLEARGDAMQELFPEGRVFTYALYGLAWVDVGRGTEDAKLRAHALAEARRALALAESPRSRSTFGEAGGLPYGMFYEGWTAHLRAGVLHLGGGAPADTAFRAACDRLETAFAAGEPFLESYRGAAWPADNA